MEIIGILDKAGQARDDTVVGQEKEQVELAYISAAVRKLGDNVDKDDLQDELDTSVGEDKTTVTGSGTLKVKFEDTKNEYTVSQNGMVAKYETVETTDVYVALCTDTDGKTLVFSNNYEAITGSYTVETNYGNIKNNHYDCVSR